MDASGRDRPTALVWGRASAELAAVVWSLAERGYEVHLPAAVLVAVPRAGRPDAVRRRLHPARDAEAALLAAVAGRARPVEVAVVGEGDHDPGSAAVERAVAAYQRTTGRGRLVRLTRFSRSRRRGTVERALAALLDGGPRPAPWPLRPVASRRGAPVLVEVSAGAAPTAG